MGFFSRLFGGHASDATKGTRPQPSRTLVNQYGALLERSGGLICSEGLLPASKEEIKVALIVAASAAKSTGSILPQVLEHFCIAYASLANFVAPADAKIASQFSNLVKAGANMEANDERLLDVVEGLTNYQAVEIQQRSNEEFARLVKEFDAAVGR
jgi:hypothetical protein